MKHTWTTKCFAWMLAGAIAATGLPSVSYAAEGTEPPLLADFNFNAEAADGAFQGGNALASVNGACATQKKVGTDNALYLNGADSFLNVTAADGSGLLAGKEEITISYDAKPEKGSASWTFYAAPNGNTQTYQQEHYLGMLHTSSSLSVERYNNSGARPGNNLSASVKNEWTHIDLTVSQNATTLYVNGEKKDSKESAYKLSDILGASGGIIQIGKANWVDGEYFGGWIDNCRIYDGILSEEAIEAQYQEFASTLEDIKKEEEEEEKRQEEEAKRQALQKDYDALTIPNADDVRGNLGLIKKGRYGSTIEWTSNKKDVVTDSSDSAIYDGGIVTRPNAGSPAVDVTLTAVLKSAYNDDTKTKTFQVKVQPKEANLDTDYTGGYLWTNFGTEGGYEKIFYGYSEDGLTWKKLNKVDGVAKPILANDGEGSDLGVRDPHVIRSAEGDRYWILGTDLHAEGGGAGGSGWDQLGASQNLVVWESKDLVNWSEPQLVFAGFDQAGCVWAPEAIYDETAGDYVVYWSARDKSKAGTEENALRVYVCRTRDFHTFSEPKVWLSEDQDTGDEVNIIDSTIAVDNGKFYRFSTSDWNTVIDVSDTLDTEDVLDVRTDGSKSTPKGSWTRLVSRNGSGAAGFDRREGFTVYKLPDGRWCAMGDSSGYKAFVTDDLASGKFEGANANFADGRFRHGTVMRLSKTEEARILEAFKDRASEPGEAEKPAQEPVLTYDFENDLDKKEITDTATGNESKDNGKLFGSAKVVYDEARQSNVLKLDGANGGYAEFPKGFFDKRNTMTISMDVKSELSGGNFFTFTYGKDSTVYDFLRIRGTEVRNAITLSSWENEKDVKGTGAPVGAWQNVVIVIEDTNMKLYLDGILVSENEDTGILTSAMGTDLLAYLGKSMYSGDAYFKGSFDNIKVYNRALTTLEILGDKIDTVPLLSKATVGTVPEDPDNTMGTDSHTAITAKIDQEKKEITSYVRKGTDLTAVPVSFEALFDGITVTVDGKAFTSGVLDLTKDIEVTAAIPEKRTETYTLKTPKIALNPVLPGQYADPDIDYFDGKYWIYPTTDGFSGWGGSVFHAWSSENLEDWTDEGIILDVKEKNPGTNDKGVAIAASLWSDGNAWAPSIEEKNGKYYFYYCGNINGSYTGTCGGGKAIGVAVADSPAGPFVANELPIVYPKMMSDANIGWSGQVIDPSIFTDDDGTSYLFFGNGGNGTAMVELNDDMMTAKTSTLKRVNGMRDFRESVVVIKRNGLYHFTWSCDDTGSPNYHVNYGTAEKLDGNVEYKYTLLQKDESGDMLGTAHQSLVYHPDTDKCYIAYHRFYTPLGVYTSGLGYHRETCIEEVTFDPETGLMNPLKPTMEGVSLKPSQEDQEKKDQQTLKGIMDKADFSSILQNGTITSSTKLDLPASFEGASITWKSSNAAVISDNGTVTYPAVDTQVTLTATFTYGLATAAKEYTVTVVGPKVPPMDDVKTLREIMEKADFSSILQNGTIKKAGKLNLPSKLEGASITWKSSNTAIIANNGTVKLPKKETKVTLTATFTYKTATDSKKYTVSVKGSVIQPTKVTLNVKKSSITLGKKEKVTLKATVSPKNASQKVTWTSSKPKTVQVSSKGTITAKATGSAKITAKASNGKKATLTVKVKNAPKKVKLNKTAKTLKKGKTFQIKASVPSGTASYAFKYSSNKKSVATVSSAGKVTAKKKGRATITVKSYNGKKATLKITVK